MNRRISICMISKDMKSSSVNKLKMIVFPSYLGHIYVFGHILFSIYHRYTRACANGQTVPTREQVLEQAQHRSITPITILATPDFNQLFVVHHCGQFIERLYSDFIELFQSLFMDHLQVSIASAQLDPRDVRQGGLANGHLSGPFTHCTGKLGDHLPGQCQRLFIAREHHQFGAE